MADTKQNYAEELEAFTKKTPAEATNKYIESLVAKAKNEGKAEAGGKGFWNGFLLGLVVAIILMFLWRS